MLLRTPQALRSVVAFFNMKHFQVHHKVQVTPSTLHEVFSTYLRPEDRLLRQSRAGAGSTRVLVLNKQQMVKAVYMPLLCVPHPSMISAENAVLGLPVTEYLESVKAAQEKKTTSFAALSYPSGISFSIFDTDGTCQLPMVNLTYTHISTDANVARGIGKHAYMSAGTPNKSRAVEFVKGLSKHQEPLIDCSTFYMINRERGTCLMLGDVQRLLRQQDPDEEMVTGMEDREEPLEPEELALFADTSRWVPLPEQALQSKPECPLYVNSVPSAEGLKNAMATGMLLLDFKPKAIEEKKSV